MHAYKMYMMTPNDQMSQDLSYFSGPRTSGAKIRTILDNLSIYFLSYALNAHHINPPLDKKILTNIVRCITRCLKCFLAQSFFSKPEIGKFKHTQGT